MVKHYDTSVELCGVKLTNPVIPASGTFGFGREFAEYYDLDCLGAISFKGTTRDARFGNPTPRIAECPAGMLNAVGLQNPGVEHVIAHELPEMKKYFSKKVIANVSGFSVEDYAYTCQRLDKCPEIGIPCVFSPEKPRFPRCDGSVSCERAELMAGMGANVFVGGTAGVYRKGMELSESIPLLRAAISK